ncbi:hypothetical protein NHX12_008692, partial [Muraenolepis orangiensis]
ELRNMAVLCFLANVCMAVSVVIIFIYILSVSVIIFLYILSDFRDAWRIPLTSPVGRFPFFFGTAIFAFEGIGVVLPLENQMRDPKRFPMALNIGMGIVTVLYVTLGTLGYLHFGETIKGSITLNLPHDAWALGLGAGTRMKPLRGLYLLHKVVFDGLCRTNQLVKILYSFGVFVSFAIQFFVPADILLPPLCSRLPESSRRVSEMLLRGLLVCLTFSWAVLIPRLDLVISLVGAVSSSALALIFPPLIELIAYSDRQPAVSPAVLVKNLLIALVGFVGFLTGTYVTVAEILSPGEGGEEEWTVAATLAAVTQALNATDGVR